MPPPPSLRLSPQTVLVLETFLDAPRHWRYGYDMSRETGLKSGTLYPILIRLADHGLVETQWEATDPGRPPRHMYRLTAEGRQAAREQVQAFAARRGGRSTPRIAEA
ncbi:MAG TPA: PadR family transcriptional regulator [Gemmatimonadales bacterium]|nr:PadR family transcriptional regulator [Gemmatimonadales bacterium]